MDSNPAFPGRDDVLLSPSGTSRFPEIPAVAAYAAMIAAAVGCFFLIRAFGSTLTGRAPIAPSSVGQAATHAPSALLHVLFALAVVIAVGRLFGRCLEAIGQPPVIGEMLAGIALGPSLLGRIAPGAAAYVLPGSVAPFLSVIAQLGVILYMFRVGLELDPDAVRGRAHATVAISHTSILVPFLLGSALALWLFPTLSTGHTSFTTFALFMGVAMSVTAFPVLARILADRGLTHTQIGAVAIACAAVDDVTAWCLLALVQGIAHSRASDTVRVIALTAAFILAMGLVLRPFIARLLSRLGDRQTMHDVLTVTLMAVFVAALVTEAIGIHAIFGAFVLGVIIPRESALAAVLIRRSELLVMTVLLPAYFAFTGMRTEIGLLAGPSAWIVCGAIVAVATLGKLGGSLAAARVCGLSWEPALTLGILMNTRGLMELIVLNIGLDLNVLSRELFAMMVIMAVVTTLATTPAIQLLRLLPLDGRKAARLRLCPESER